MNENITHIENKIEELLKNNLKWSINYKIPVEIIDKMPSTNRKNAFLAGGIEVHRYEDTPIDIIIHDLNDGGLYPASIIPVNLMIDKKYLNNKSYELEQVLLHELNHWYTYELHGYHVQTHGVEFRKCGKKVGLKPRYNCAKIKPQLEENEIIVHQISCSKCGQPLLHTKTKKEAMDLKKRYLTQCCTAKIKYDGRFKADKNN